MKIKTSELTDRALDWAVAKAVGAIGPCQIYENDPRIGLLVGGSATLKSGAVVGEHRPEYVIFENGEGNWHPSVDWAQGGLLIEREQITLTPPDSPGLAAMGVGEGRWGAGGVPPCKCYQTAEGMNYGETPLIAAMRAIVTAQLGEEIEVPKELVKS